MNFIGREHELKILSDELLSGKSSFIAVYGRRRIGKTELIEHFIAQNSSPSFCITAAYNASSKAHFENFIDKFTLTFSYATISMPTSWNEAFGMLKEAIGKTQTQSSSKFIVFIDELPWFASGSRDFKSALSLFWNDFAAKRDDVMLIVCGSASSWIINHIIEDRGSLSNRLTALIHLMPFNLVQTKLFLTHNGHLGISDKAVLEYAMVFGGIAYYLSLLNPVESFVQNLNRLFFTSNGLLRDEYHKLFRSLFENFKTHEIVIAELIKHTQGKTKTELSKHKNLTLGSVLDTAMKELEASGLISSTQKYNQTTREVIYTLSDTFISFAAKWVNGVSSVELAQNRDYFYNIYKSQSFKSWNGFAFEALCHTHIKEIKTMLGIAGVQTKSSYWAYKPKTPDEQGVQIDLLIDRDDGIIDIIECKYHSEAFTIDKKYAKELKAKEDVFRTITKSSKTIHIVMITAHGVTKNSYYDEIVTKAFTIDNFFKESK